MREFSGFIGDTPLVAHNASFDRRFLDAEFKRIGQQRRQEFGCSMLAARRVYPDAPNHKLATLVSYRNLRNDGTFHRALADAEMTARLWLAMTDDLRDRYGFEAVSFSMLRDLARVPKTQVGDYLQRCRRA
jgi:DNA polymerase-3 subunit epsilon